MTDNTALLALAGPQIAQEEGCRLTAYPDPLSGGEPWTIGYGHARGVLPGTVWTQAEADDALSEDMDDTANALDGAIAWWRGLSLMRQAVLLSMAYQLGVSSLLGFPRMLACAQAGDFIGAADQMRASRWATQTPARANRLADQMQTDISSYGG